MKYKFIAGCYHGIVEAENEEEARKKLRSQLEAFGVLEYMGEYEILLRKIEEEG